MSSCGYPDCFCSRPGPEVEVEVEAYGDSWAIPHVHVNRDEEFCHRHHYGPRLVEVEVHAIPDDIVDEFAHNDRSATLLDYWQRRCRTVEVDRDWAYRQLGIR